MAIIPLSNSRHAIVDDDDKAFLLQWKWGSRKNSNYWYAKRSSNSKDDESINKDYYMQHAVLTRNGILVPPMHVIDHINHDGLDNRKCNLAVATYAQNGLNAMQRDSNSGFRGVRYDHDKAMYKAYVTIDGVEKFISYSHDKRTAAMDRDFYSIRLYKHAALNFPQFRDRYFKGEAPLLPTLYEMTPTDQYEIDTYVHTSNRNQSGYRGVYAGKISASKGTRWNAQSIGLGKRKYLGVYSTAEEASAAVERDYSNSLSNPNRNQET